MNKAAVLLALKRDFDVIIKDCTDVLTIEPENTKALSRRAQALAATEEHDDAMRDINRALDIKPDDALLKRTAAVLKKQAAAYRKREAKKYGKMFG